MGIDFCKTTCKTLCLRKDAPVSELANQRALLMLEKVTCRGTSLRRNRRPLGPYRRTMPRALWESWGGGRFRMSEVPLYARPARSRLLPGTAGTGVRSP